MVEINWTLQAVNNIDEIAVFIAKDSLKYAQIFTRQIFERADILKTNPNIGRIVPELENGSIREIIFGNYRLIYFIKNAERIDIIAIHHSSRNINFQTLFE